MRMLQRANTNRPWRVFCEAVHCRVSVLTSCVLSRTDCSLPCSCSTSSTLTQARGGQKLLICQIETYHPEQKVLPTGKSLGNYFLLPFPFPLPEGLGV
eukprot:996834-Amphidinium_carterae.1